MKRLALTKDNIARCYVESNNDISKRNAIMKIEIKRFINRINNITNWSKNLKENNPSLLLAKKMLNQNVYVGMKMENRDITFLQTDQVISGFKDDTIATDDVQAVMSSADAWKEMFNTIYESNSIGYAAKLEEITARYEALFPGKIRTGEIFISGISYAPPIPKPDEVKQKYEKILEIKDIKDRAIELFCYITRNQVFWEGNKRTALLIANKELISHDCGVLCIDIKSINDFNLILSDFYETGDKTKIKKFLKSQIKEVFNKEWRV